MDRSRLAAGWRLERLCRFWLIDGLWSLSRRDTPRDQFADAMRHRNRYGLLSEDVDPQTGALWGNYPQT